MTDEHNIKAVIFDLGGVLVTDIFNNLDPLMAELSGRSFEESRDVRRRYWPDYELGNITGIEFMKAWADELSIKDSPEVLLARSFDMIEVNKDTLKVIAELHGRVRLAIGSNNSDEWFCHEDRLVDFDRYFDTKVCSSIEHVKKPSEEFFRLIAQRLDTPPEECLFIDNQANNLEGAKACGMQTLHFTDAAHLREDLENLGLFDRKDKEGD